MLHKDEPGSRWLPAAVDGLWPGRTRTGTLACVALLGALLLPGLLRARDACSPGEYQATPPNTPGPIACAPIPLDGNGRVLGPPPRANHWGAIASDSSAVHVAASVDLPSKPEAERAALASCRDGGGTNCSVAIAYGNGCGALVASERGLASGADVTRDFAKQGALHRCRSSGGLQCRVVHVACSDPSSNH
ncbi:DUF4189 domain-containing protein [Frateuria soli]|uniref:DUF4189 domain-containing protein n=1 Tax=Frateuria soli TaxID=1542730 RepID=UPI003CCDA253